MKLYIPSHYVGLVIGRNGRVVRELQAKFNIHIETPKFDIRQFFAVYGSKVSIELTFNAIRELLVKKSGVCFTEVMKEENEIHFLE